MKEKKNILFTFDYELFLGSRSGTVDSCLIVPTQKIVQELKEFNAKGIFFVDTSYLLRLKDEKAGAAQDDYRKVVSQLQQLVLEGHYVFPHIHPHWLDAAYDAAANQWNLRSSEKYRFHNTPVADRGLLFDASFKLLQEIAPDHKLDSYRAGGWSIQPFSDYQPYFTKHGIKYDFSVLPGFKCISDTQHYDFTSAPSKPVYRFSSDVVLEDAAGEFTEFAISRIRVSSLHDLLNKIFMKLSPGKYKSSGDGLSAYLPCREKQKETDFEMASLELLTSAKLSLYCDHAFQNEFIQFISHPKMMSKDNFVNFRKFNRKVFSSYTVETDFKKMLPA